MESIGKSDRGNGKSGRRHIGNPPRVLIVAEDRRSVTCRYRSGWRRFGVTDSELIHGLGGECVNGVLKGMDGQNGALWSYGSYSVRESLPIS